MSEKNPTVEDLWRWVEPIPEWTRSDWCLPAIGGRVLLRGFDTERSSLFEFDRVGWGLDVTLVPLTESAAQSTDGPSGGVFPGDCVIFIGLGEYRDDPVVWFPQRIVHVADGPRGWQRVWAIRDLSLEDDDNLVELVSPDRIPRQLLTSEPLHGNDRRAMLEIFGLNVDCEHCGRRGEALWFGQPRDPMLRGWGGEWRRPDSETYACACDASWRVDGDGTLHLRRPMPVM
jgi:hypothetical protein